MPAVRFCCCAQVHARLCEAGGAFYARFMPSFAGLLTRFAFVHARRAVLTTRLAFVHACRAVLATRLAFVHARLCGAVVAFCAWFMPGFAGLATRLALVHACCLTHCAQFMPGRAILATRFAFVHARLCGAVDASCLRSRSALRFWRRGLPWFMLGFAVLATRFALGSRPALRGCCCVLRLVHARPRGSGGAFCAWFMPAVRFWRRVLPSVHARRAGLATRLAFVHACCTVLLLRFAFVHACCLTHCAKQDGLRYLAFLFRRVEIAIRAFS